MYMHTTYCTYAYMYRCTCTKLTHTYTHVHLHNLLHIHTHVHSLLHTYTCTHIQCTAHMYTYCCTHVHIYTDYCTYVQMYTCSRYTAYCTYVHMCIAHCMHAILSVNQNVIDNVAQDMDIIGVDKNITQQPNGSLKVDCSESSCPISKYHTAAKWLIEGRLL